MQSALLTYFSRAKFSSLPEPILSDCQTYCNVISVLLTVCLEGLGIGTYGIGLKILALTSSLRASGSESITVRIIRHYTTKTRT